MSAPPPDASQPIWSSRLTFIMASVGFAVGLGNIWRFPYIVGENGGSAFILIYLAFAVLIGVPLVMAEWTIGRRAHDAASASGSFRGVARQSGASTKWGNVGGIAVLAVFMLMLFYTTIAGWTMDYFVRAASGAFHGITSEASALAYDDLMSSPLRLVFWHTVVVVLTVYINSRGLHGGIEKAVNFLMPALFASLVLMVAYAAVVGDMRAAADFLLSPDFSRVNGETLLIALGQAFLSIGIAMAVMITYGSYLDNSTSIPQNAFIVVGADTLVAMMAGFAIFPLVFQHGMAPNAGEGLVFQTLPVAFGDLPAGSLFASIFFFLLIAAAVVIPGATARLVSRSIGAMLAVSTGLGVVAAVVGLYVSFYLDVPSGPSIVLTGASVFAVVALGSAVVSRRALGAARRSSPPSDPAGPDGSGLGGGDDGQVPLGARRR